jgi:hypothetical protein
VVVTGLALPVSIWVCARIAGLAILAAEATAVATHGDLRSKPGIWTVLVAVQVVVVWWATDRRSAALLRMVAPAVLTGVTVTAVWTAVALAVPVITTGNAAALIAIITAGLLVAAAHRGAGRRLLPIVMIAPATTALLIFLVIGSVLPGVPGFVSNSYPPIYTLTPATRMVDPIGEFGVFVLLAAAVAVELIRARIRDRRAAAPERRPGYGTGRNEMVVERTATAVQPADTEAGR